MAEYRYIETINVLIEGYKAVSNFAKRVNPGVWRSWDGKNPLEIMDELAAMKKKQLARLPHGIRSMVDNHSDNALLILLIARMTDTEIAELSRTSTLWLCISTAIASELLSGRTPCVNHDGYVKYKGSFFSASRHQRGGVWCIKFSIHDNVFVYVGHLNESFLFHGEGKISCLTQPGSFKGCFSAGVISKYVHPVYKVLLMLRRNVTVSQLQLQRAESQVSRIQAAFNDACVSAAKVHGLRHWKKVHRDTFAEREAERQTRAVRAAAQHLKNVGIVTDIFQELVAALPLPIQMHWSDFPLTLCVKKSRRMKTRRAVAV